MSVVNILIVGVGGQGTLLASTVLGNLALNAGLDVKLSEVHGMAQRGGSVVTHVRFGEKVYAPIVDKGQADIIIAFEELEALRYLSFLKPGGKLYVNSQEILPMPVITGAAKYPENIREFMEENHISVEFVDALSIAREVGNIKAVNTVMLGYLANSLSFTKENWMNALKECVKPKFLEVNQKAFLATYHGE